MAFYRQYQFRLSKADTTGILFRRAVDVVGDTAVIKFYFEDSNCGNSVVARVVRLFPELAVHERACRQADASPRILSNLDGRFSGYHASVVTKSVSTAILAEIADGVPRRFPFQYATFLLEGFPAHGISPPPASGRTWPASAPAMLGDAVPGILLTSQWSSTRRQIALSATVPVPAPEPNALKVGTPATEVLARLRQLGAVKTRAPLVGLFADADSLPDPATLAEVSTRWNERLRDTLTQIRLPHVLSDKPLPAQGSGITSPHKDDLTAVFKPRAYRSNGAASGPGLFALTKTTLRRNRLTLGVDVGTWSHACSAFLELKGLGWRTTFSLAVSPGPHGHQYPIGSQWVWRQIVENLAALVDHAEATSVLAAEELAPPAPAWFAAENP